MKKCIFVLAIILLSTPAFAGPSLQFETETHNFGTVQEGDQLEYSFAFVNAGPADVSIERVKAS